MKQSLLKKLAFVLILLATMGITAKAQNAINLDGTNNKATAAYNLDLINGFTVEYGMYIDDFNNLIGGVTAAKNNVAAPLDNYIDPSGSMSVFIGDGSNYTSASIPNFFTTGQWYNIAITYDPNNNDQVFVIVNGTQMANFSAGFAANNGHIIIGNRADGATDADAQFRNVMIWSGVRNGVQIANDFSSCAMAQPALQVYYPMGEASGNILHNWGSAGSAANAVISGNITWEGTPLISSIAVTTFKNYTSPSGNYVWKKSGNYSDTITSIITGCKDSVVLIALTRSSHAYVNVNAAGGGNGLSWASPFTDFGVAVDSVGAGDTIWVAQGTYQPGSGLSFSMKDSVAIYGGFVGDETAISQRNWQANVTTLNGNNAILIDNTSNNLTRAAVLDGFTIANGSNSAGDAGGMDNSNSSPTLTNLVFNTNEAPTGDGGAIFDGNSSSPVLLNVSFYNNFGGEGAAISQADGSISITNCIFFQNQSLITGGAIYIHTGASATVTNCTFDGNTSNFSGGGIDNEGTLVLTNSVFWNNGTNTGNYKDVQNGGTLTETYNYTQAALGGTGDVVGGSSPFVNDGNVASVTGTDGIWATADDGLHLDPTNGLAAIGTGNVAAVPAGVTTDITGVTTRVQNGKVDMGAYSSECNTVAFTSATSCDSYSFTSLTGTYTVTTSGTVLDTIHNKAACDSIIHIAVTINKSNAIDTTVVACGNFTWYGKNFIRDTNSATHMYTNVSGCDSIITLKLTVKKVSTGDTTAVSCDNFYWYGNYYYSTGTVTDTLQNHVGCDSIVTLHLTINNSVELDSNQTGCNQYTWRGTTYTQSGWEYAYFASKVTGCDSTIGMYITIYHDGQSANTVGTYASTYLFNSKVITASGHYADTLFGAGSAGCDSVVNLYLTMYQPAMLSGGCAPANLNLSGTPTPEYINWKMNGNYVTTDTVKWDTGTVVAQDRLDNNALAIAVDTAGNLYVGDGAQVLKYPKNSTPGTPGVVVASTGLNNVSNIKVDMAGNIFLADNTGNSEIYEFPVGSDSTTTPIDVAWFYGRVSDMYVDNADNIYVSANNSNNVNWFASGVTGGYSNQGITIAQNGIRAIGGITVDNSGNLFVSDTRNEDVLEFPKGSNSSTSGSLVVEDGLNSNSSFDGMSTVALDGNGDLFVLTAQYNNNTGNDSSVIYIYPPGSTATTHPIDSVGLTGMVNNYQIAMDASGSIYAVSSTSMFVKKFNNIIKMTDSAKAAGTYTAVYGSFSGSQDSAKITIGAISSSNTNASGCDSYTSPSGKYNWTSTNTYMDTIKNKSGCDSVMTVNVTINYSTTSDTAAVACGSFKWYGTKYTSTGTPTHLYTSHLTGCDSTVTLHLTVNNADTSITQNANVLTANATSATYQWFTCGTPNMTISGATGQAYTTTADGNYAVSVTQNGCTDTSDCRNVIETGVNNTTVTDNVTIYPMPNNGQFTISFNGSTYQTVTVYDETGKQITKQTINGNADHVQLDLSAYADGLYYARLVSVNGVVNKKVVIQK